MADIIDGIYSWVSFLPRITIYNLAEILIIAVLLYEVLAWIMNTRAWTLLKGIIVILLFYVASYIFRLDNILWILNKIATPAVTMAIVIFQPELRKALEQLGSKNIITDLFISENSRQQEGYTEKTVNEITRAAFEMGKVKTGALIVIERDTPLPEIERTGIPVDGIVTSQLLINIFEHNTPLHDGAIIIRGNRVTSATCYLPLSDNLSISKDLGTRHRAALGISESTDSLTVVVSEETGRVSLAAGGSLRRINSPEELKLAIAAKPEEETVSGPFKLLKGWHKNERKAE